MMYLYKNIHVSCHYFYASVCCREIFCNIVAVTMKAVYSFETTFSKFYFCLKIGNPWLQFMRCLVWTNSCFNFWWECDKGGISDSRVFMNEVISMFTHKCRQYVSRHEYRRSQRPGDLSTGLLPKPTSLKERFYRILISYTNLFMPLSHKTHYIVHSRYSNSMECVNN